MLGKILDFRSTEREKVMSDVDEASVRGDQKYMSTHIFPLRNSEIRDLIVANNNNPSVQLIKN